MRFLSLSICLHFVLLACSGGSDEMKADLIREELDIGEYLHRQSLQHALTFNREGDDSGLVQIDLDSGELKVLDPLGSQGKDLISSGDRLFYRLENEIIEFQGEERHSHPAEGIKKLRSVTVSPEGEYELHYQNLIDQSFMSCRGSTMPMVGVVLHSFFKDGLLHSLIHHDKKLFLVVRGFCSSSLIETRELVEDSHIRFIEIFETTTKLRMAYLDELRGQLFWLSFDYENDPEIELVDGVAGESFVGMDIGFFKDGEKPGLIYLDAWALKIRMARFVEGEWKSWKLSIPGAVGFYNQANRVDEETVDLIFHAYRTQMPSLASSFENLMRTKIRLSEFE